LETEFTSTPATIFHKDGTLSMSKLISTLKEEIVRIARKEIRTEIEALRKASKRYRSEIAELKRQLTQLERQLRKEGFREGVAPAPESEGTGNFRFRADGLRGHRERLGITAKDMAALLDVSVQTVANWESGKTKPRASQLGTIAAMRKLGKRDVAQRLAAREN
jgi:DNA-binding XRE family transcriptional regulator